MAFIGLRTRMSQPLGAAFLWMKTATTFLIRRKTHRWCDHLHFRWAELCLNGRGWALSFPIFSTIRAVLNIEPPIKYFMPTRGVRRFPRRVSRVIFPASSPRARPIWVFRWPGLATSAGYQHELAITCENKGTVEVGGKLVLTLGRLSYQNADPAPSSVSGNKLTWTFPRSRFLEKIS